MWYFYQLVQNTLFYYDFIFDPWVEKDVVKFQSGRFFKLYIFC